MLAPFAHAGDPIEGPAIVIACTPKGLSEDDPGYCDEESLVKTIYEACQIDVEPEEDIVVPHTLIPEDEVLQAIKNTPPAWKAGQFSDGTPDTAPDSLTRPFTLRRLGNGIRIASMEELGPGGRCVVPICACSTFGFVAETFS